LRQVAERHGLVCLLHEKPFAGVNGSGKHNNWSLSYGKRNLLNPGKDPQDNAIFMTVLCAIIAAVDRHADLLRASVAGAGNDHRLGGNEAPPAVISMYLGDQLEDVIDQVEKGQVKSSRSGGTIRIGVDTLPPLPRDATDRNRTSPFAFTGNKFEFRAPGSSQNCSSPNVMLNTIIAEAFDLFADKLEKLSPENFQAGLQKLLSNTIRKHRRIIFNGDGYTDAWLEEAARRGLPNAPATMEALSALTKPANIALFEKYGVFGSRELASRYEVFVEDYARRVMIEVGIALEIADSMIAPAATAEYGRTVSALASGQASGVKSGLAALKKRAETLGKALDELAIRSDALRKAQDSGYQRSLKALNELRDTVDELEKILPDESWPLPKYREMLFIY
ncbi:MAG: glutamine synthetase type III, partial [Lentisphaeria bacterium]|nr:glutamine synthetase type III [Lentisphaeria bacterium]